ncbi:DUF1236 domain-containing protein [Hyphomicrobium sp.]|uniref:DUF1236 domain-containing protein n=1 Tax=Hyphomicrobium sp. TaxID=82 RepID=UPI0025C63D60|nr:DUF1236 domain-containing protein [Hyphomicrobium sp.]MCC7251784.1 DUF1236 domain-containing protein [Hyphomicrobium sp.]
MNKPTLGLAALLMLGGTTIAVAQDGRRDTIPGPAQGLERGPDLDVADGDGPRAGGARGDALDSRGAEEAPGMIPDAGRRAEGPNPDARKDPPEPEPSGAERTDDARGQDRARARDDSEAGQKTSDDAKDRGRKPRTETRDKTGDASSDEPKVKKDAQAKPDRERGDRGERAKGDGGKDAADAKKAEPADTGKAAETDKADKGKAAETTDQADTGKATAEGDRKALEEARKADLSGERRERVSTAFRERRDVKRRTDVDIDISVGARLPGDWEFVPVPTSVVEVVPEYRGYVFAYVDDEYVICDPVTYEVVAVLPAADGPRYAGGGGGAAERCSETLTLSEDERDDLVRSIQMNNEVDVSDITVGWSVPGEIELKTFPEPVISRTGKLASCRYFVADDQIAIVDPAEETVVLLIDHD